MILVFILIRDWRMMLMLMLINCNQILDLETEVTSRRDNIDNGVIDNVMDVVQ